MGVECCGFMWIGVDGCGLLELWVGMDAVD
jgi:hypothetical protein